MVALLESFGLQVSLLEAAKEEKKLHMSSTIKPALIERW
jgi:hypothetical protein